MNGYVIIALFFLALSGIVYIVGYMARRSISKDEFERSHNASDFVACSSVERTYEGLCGFNSFVLNPVKGIERKLNRRFTGYSISLSFLRIRSDGCFEFLLSLEDVDMLVATTVIKEESFYEEASKLLDVYNHN